MKDDRLAEKLKTTEEKRSFWKSHLESWKKTTKSQSQYCHDHSISYTAFNYWRNRLNKEKAESTQFIKVSPPPVNMVAHIIQAKLPNGVVINLPFALGLDNILKLIQGCGGADVKATA
jgi:hypothetical protein